MKSLQDEVKLLEYELKLLKDKETEEHFVIKNIYIDEDDDVIFEIEKL